MTTDPAEIAARLVRDGYPLAAVPDPPAEAERRHYRSGQEVFEATPEEVPWCWHGFLAYGLVTLFAGRHKGGKSTLLFSLIRAIVDGDDAFLNHAIDPGPVVLLTEEGPETLRPKLEPISPEGRTRIRILDRSLVSPRGDYAWPLAVRDAGQEALDWGARLIVIDTFAFWSQIRDENDNGLMQEIVSVLGDLTTRGLAVVVVHHHRKSGGEDGDAIRGGTGLQGAVDVIVELVRPPSEGEDDDNSTERELRAIGRFPESPEALRVKLNTHGTYEVIGEGTRAQMRNLGNDAKVRAHLSENAAEAHAMADLEAATGIARATLQRVLLALERGGEVESFAEGGRGKKRYRWVAEPYPRGPLNGGEK